MLEVGLNGQVLPYPRGFVTGGSSALSKFTLFWSFFLISYPRLIDAMVYARGPSEDFDRLALVSGDDGWNWTSLQPYILKVDFIPLLCTISQIYCHCRMSGMSLTGLIAMLKENIHLLCMELALS